MTLRQPYEEAVLSGEEIAVVRRALAACSQLLTRAQHDAGPAGTLVARATRAAASGRSPDGLIYDINLAIDYPGFAPAARRLP